MKLVIIESPFAGDVIANIDYARACMRDSLARGEAPFASHLLYTRILDDSVLTQRNMGLSAGLAWAQKADLTAAYIDFGISKGMSEGIADAERAGRPVEMRFIKNRRWISHEEELQKPR